MIAATKMMVETAPASDRHLIDVFIGDPAGPTLIAIGSLHGNEPAGAEALRQVSLSLESLAAQLRGRVYLIAGNTRALDRRVRFIDHDLNRSWTRRNLSSVASDFLTSAEGAEVGELNALLDSIMITARDEVYVIDLHSTSAAGSPFITLGDTMRNRRFAERFPVRILLGIEEQLEGTLLEYLNNAGAVTVGFEGGKHLSPLTVENHVALVWLALVNAGILDPTEVPSFDDHNLRLAAGISHARFYEVLYREPVVEQEDFVMRPGFRNFEPVGAGRVLADKNGAPIAAPVNGILLMPLYQKLGEDGFFIGREVAPFWLRLSGILRRHKVQEFMHWLPGVRRDPDDKETLVVNTRVARLMPLQVFHLLGYRRIRWVASELVVSRRRHDTDSPFVAEHGR